MQCGAAGVLTRALAIGVLAIWVSGCVTGGQRTGNLQTSQRPSVAFESIDGAPPAVFQKLVQKLNEEADARQVPVVTREGYAPYRIRGYVAASVVKKQTVVSWVWDVYDGETRRAARLTGEEKAGPAGPDAWNAANNEAVLARVARSGMEQLAAFLNTPLATPSGPAPSPGSPDEDGRLTVAAADDFRPEAQGIFRLPQAPEPAVTGSVPADSGAPLPPRRPVGRPQQVATANAF
jgi:hypothetical protein